MKSKARKPAASSAKKVASKKTAAPVKKAVSKPSVKKAAPKAAAPATNKITTKQSQENMELKTIQDLINFVSKSGVSEVTIEQKEFKINIKTPSAFQTTMVAASAPVQMQVSTPAPVASSAPVAAAPAAAPAASTTEDTSKLVTIKSPMIGTFYRTPSPDKPSFVNVGDEVKAGKVVCIIEAMKLFNEIESEVSGKIVKVLVDNASPVEYDQPLFLVEPN